MEDESLDEEMMEEECTGKNEDVYSDESRADLVEDDEISAEEEGFMEGAEYDGQHAKCASCGKMITKETTIEKEVEGEKVWFCSEHCAEKYEEKREKKEED